MRNSLDVLLSDDRLRAIRDRGIIVFDVDDTLLARKNSPDGQDQIYSESEAAKALPFLLQSGYRLCLITGHGWNQLAERLVEPLFADLKSLFPDRHSELLRRFFIYANRGATRIDTERLEIDRIFGQEFAFTEPDRAALGAVLSDSSKFWTDDFSKRPDWYTENFPGFAFHELPATVVEREGVVLSLRPLPSEAHAAPGVAGSPRQTYMVKAFEAMREAGLSEKYTVEQAGKSTLEITRKNVSKRSAFRDLMTRISAETGISVHDAEKSSLYIGDEFAERGNDREIAETFPGCLCISVRTEGHSNVPGNVRFVDGLDTLEKTQVTLAITSYILKSSF